jgi:preprotein translocase subunit SecE
MAKPSKGNSAKGAKGGKSKGGKQEPKPNVFVRFGRYLRDVWAELKRVVWPGRTEVLNSSVVVIVTVLFFVAFTFIIDQLSTEFVRLIAQMGG